MGIFGILTDLISDIITIGRNNIRSEMPRKFKICLQLIFRLLRDPIRLRCFHIPVSYTHLMLTSIFIFDFKILDVIV